MASLLICHGTDSQAILHLQIFTDVDNVQLYIGTKSLSVLMYGNAANKSFYVNIRKVCTPYIVSPTDSVGRLHVKFCFASYMLH